MKASPKPLTDDELEKTRRERDEAIVAEDATTVLQMTNALLTRAVLGVSANDLAAQGRALYLEGMRLACQNENASVYFEAAKSVLWSAVHRGIKDEKSGERELPPAVSKCWYALRLLGVEWEVFDTLVFRLRQERDELRRE